MVNTQEFRIANAPIWRKYQCTNPECEMEFVLEQKIKDAWKKRCPSCQKHSLVMRGANSNLTFFIDLGKPKTLGMLGQQNRDRMKKDGTLPADKPRKKWNWEILKNPKKYIETGRI